MGGKKVTLKLGIGVVLGRGTTIKNEMINLFSSLKTPFLPPLPPSPIPIHIQKSSTSSSFLYLSSSSFLSYYPRVVKRTYTKPPLFFLFLSSFSFNNSQQKPIIVLLADRLQQDTINSLIIPDVLHRFPDSRNVYVGCYQVLRSQ